MSDAIRIAQISEYETGGLLVRAATIVLRVDSAEVGDAVELANECLRAATREGATAAAYMLVRTHVRVLVMVEASWSRFGAVRRV